MPRFRFSRGTNIRFRGQEYAIEKRLHNRDLVIKHIVTSECQAVPEADLIAALFDGHMEFLPDKGSKAYSQEKSLKFVVEDLGLLDDDDPIKKKKKERLKKETLRRHRYVSEICAQGLTKLTPSVLQPVIDSIKKQTNDPSPPSPITLYRWCTTYRAASEDIRVLIPAHSKKGNTKRKFGYRSRQSSSKLDGHDFTDTAEAKAKEVAEIIDTAISDVYLNEQRLPVEEVITAVHTRVIENNRYRNANDQLPLPDRTSIFRIVSNLPGYEKDLARYGQRYADLKHKSVGRGPRPTRPLEIVQMDSTTLDLFVVDEELGMPIGRPTLFTAIDVRTKMDVGYHLSFNDTSYLAVMQCLLHSIAPKNYVRERYPRIKHEWNCYGLMEVLKVDNAMPFHGESLEDAALQLGFAIDYAPVGTPWYKSSIERFIGTKNRQLIHRQPGTTFSNIFHKGEYDSKKHAVITRKALDEIVHVYLIDIYPRQKHRGINDVPARLWDELIKEFPPALPSKSADLNVLLGHVIWRKIGRTGIEIDGLYYKSDDLAALRSRTKDKKKKFKIKKNPEDLSLIHVADEFNGRYIPVPAEDQGYTKGLTQFQHDVIRNLARKRVEDYVNIEDLCEAKKYINEIVRNEWGKSKKSGSRVTMGRYLNYGKTNGDGASKNTNSSDEEIQTSGTKPVVEFPRLNNEALTGKGVSNLGNAFTVSSRPNAEESDQAKQPVSAEQMSPSDSKESTTQDNRARSSRKAAKEPSRNSNRKSPSPATTKIQSDKPVHADRTGWEVEYD